MCIRDRSPSCLFNEKRIVNILTGGRHPCKRRGRRCGAAVSYTHLDVYKRQLLSSYILAIDPRDKLLNYRESTIDDEHYQLELYQDEPNDYEEELQANERVQNYIEKTIHADAYRFYESRIDDNGTQISFSLRCV